MTGPLGNSEFCFPRISIFPEKQNSLFPSETTYPGNVSQVEQVVDLGWCREHFGNYGIVDVNGRLKQKTKQLHKYSKEKQNWSTRRFIFFSCFNHLAITQSS